MKLSHPSMRSEKGVEQVLHGGDMAKTIREVHDQATKLCRDLRRRQTNAERIFWEVVRNRRFHGKRFLRQHPIFHEDNGSHRFYVVDFFCHDWRLVVELDGSSHDGQEESDVERSDIIEASGITVVRFRNEDVENDISGVLRKLEKQVRI